MYIMGLETWKSNLNTVFIKNEASACFSPSETIYNLSQHMPSLMTPSGRRYFQG